MRLLAIAPFSLTASAWADEAAVRYMVEDKLGE